MKEMFFGAGIEQHDFETKLRKVIKFLNAGNPCRVSIIAKRQTRKTAHNKYMLTPHLAVDETTMKILEGLSDLPVTIQQEVKKEKAPPVQTDPLVPGKDVVCDAM